MTLENYKNLHADFMYQNAAAPVWLSEWQNRKFARFLEEGLPTRKNEAWRYTSLKDLAGLNFNHLPTDDSLKMPFKKFSNGCHVVFVNGRFSPQFSDPLPDGVEWACTVKEAPFDVPVFLQHFENFKDDSFLALQDSFLLDGFFLKVRCGTVVREPIRMIHVSSASSGKNVGAVFLRHMISVEANAEVVLSELHFPANGNACFYNTRTDIMVEREAIVQHDVIHHESLETLSFSATRVAVLKNADYSRHYFSNGSKIMRDAVEVHLQAEAARCALISLSPVVSHAHIDHSTQVRHLAPHTQTSQICKTIVQEHGVANFSGLIHVDSQAQKTEASQLNKNILLSKHANANTRPNLRIEADDVKATHGATIGHIDPESIFYMSSRAIARDEAVRLLLGGFANDLLQRFACLELRQFLSDHLNKNFFGSEP